MTSGELTIKGDIEVLRLQPCDVIVVTIEEPRHFDQVGFDQIRRAMRERFPGHEIVIANGLRLSVQRTEVAA